MRKINLFLCAALAAAALSGCSSSKPAQTTPAATTTAAETAAETEAAPQEESSVEETANAEAAAENPFAGKTVKVGCSATYVPFESIEMAANGDKTYVGMNIDIVKSIVEKNGGEVEFSDMPFKTLIGAIQAGQIDFCSGGMTPTDERRESLDFSEIFFYPRNAIVYREGDDYPTLDSLDGKTVAYVFGTNYQAVAESIPNVNAVGIQGSSACVEEVKTKRADACIVDGASATEYLKQNENLKLSLLEKIEGDSFAFGFPKDSPYYETFNNTLKEMMENGELDEIIASHLSEEFILD